MQSAAGRSERARAGYRALIVSRDRWCESIAQGSGGSIWRESIDPALREHKKRNVSDALPERLRASVRTAMNQAYATHDAQRARRLLDNLARRLEDQHPGAAASLREGLDETLTVMRLGLPDSLERVLSSTNLIENLFSRVREIGRRVRRWQSGTMVLRWSAAGVLEAERRFRRITGYRAMPTLVAALRAHDAKLDRASTVDNKQKAA